MQAHALAVVSMDSSLIPLKRPCVHDRLVSLPWRHLAHRGGGYAGFGDRLCSLRDLRLRLGRPMRYRRHLLLDRGGRRGGMIRLICYWHVEGSEGGRVVPMSDV